MINRHPSRPNLSRAKLAAEQIVETIRPISIVQLGGEEDLSEALNALGADANFVNGLPFPAGSFDLLVLASAPETFYDSSSPALLAQAAAATDRVLLCPPIAKRRQTRPSVTTLARYLRLWATAGFAPVVEFDASAIAPMAVLLRKGVVAEGDIAALAELTAMRGRVFELESENHRLETRLSFVDRSRTPNRELIDKLEHTRSLLRDAQRDQNLATRRLEKIEASTIWRLTEPLRKLLSVQPRLRFIVIGFIKVTWWVVTLQLSSRLRARREFFNRQTEPVAAKTENVRLSSSTPPVDIVVCVHNALEDVKRCLSSIISNTPSLYNLIIIDDGSEVDTCAFLEQFARDHAVKLYRNNTALGYTFAANQGMRLSASSWIALLNSDTVVTLGWLDRMASHGDDPRVGAIGPMSNIASWQSAPKISDGGDWPTNDLPEDIDIARMGVLVRDASNGSGIPLPFLNGFCLLLRKVMLDEIGLFDEKTFGAGYGEENDLCIRARNANWKLLVASDVFVFHAQSKSYSHERRLELAQRADMALRAKHDPATQIWPQVGQCMINLAMAGTRARIESAIERSRLITEGLRRWEGIRLAVILPTDAPSGGGNVIIQEAEALGRMGVDVWLINLEYLSAKFEASHPSLSIPVLYAKNERDIANILRDTLYGFDCAIGTLYKSVFWMPDDHAQLRRAYYIQDYEPWFFDADDDQREVAFQSYQFDDRITLLTKTNWNADQVESGSARRHAVVGASVDLDLFRPASMSLTSAPHPIRVCAMVRPSTPRRAPDRTAEVLRKLMFKFGSAIDISVFGHSHSEAARYGLDLIGMRSVGEIDRCAVAELLRTNDVFLDFSDYQAMGLTALEAMASGCAVALPLAGGTRDFARPNENCLAIDTTDVDACFIAADRLISDDALRSRLQLQALADVRGLTPESAAFRIMEALFGAEGDRLAPYSSCS